MCFVRLPKHWYKEQMMPIKWGKHFSEPFHVSNGVGQGVVLSQYLFAVYLDDLYNELNNIKAGCYIGEVLLNYLMLADDICVFCPSVRWLQRILDVCQAYAESHGIIFSCNKTVCMTFKAMRAKSTVIEYRYAHVWIIAERWSRAQSADSSIAWTQSFDLMRRYISFLQYWTKEVFFTVKQTYSFTLPKRSTLSIFIKCFRPFPLCKEDWQQRSPRCRFVHREASIKTVTETLWGA